MQMLQPRMERYTMKKKNTNYRKEAENFWNSYPENLLYDDYSISVSDCMKLMAEFAEFQIKKLAITKPERVIPIVPKSERSQMVEGYQPTDKLDMSNPPCSKIKKFFRK